MFQRDGAFRGGAGTEFRAGDAVTWQTAERHLFRSGIVKSVSGEEVIVNRMDDESGRSVKLAKSDLTLFAAKRDVQQPQPTRPVSSRTRPEEKKGLRKIDIMTMTPEQFKWTWHQALPRLATEVERRGEDLDAWQKKFSWSDLRRSPSTVGKYYLKEMVRLLPKLFARPKLPVQKKKKQNKKPQRSRPANWAKLSARAASAVSPLVRAVLLDERNARRKH